MGKVLKNGLNEKVVPTYSVDPQRKQNRKENARPACRSVEGGMGLLIFWIAVEVQSLISCSLVCLVGTVG